MRMTALRSAADAYAWLGLRWVPRLLAMVDRNPLSPTYGCFDRQYWHYRTADFPCGMSQQFGLPLALAYSEDLPGDRWHGSPRLRELALAAVDFARRSAHRDGSCDDYYPFERALGATCFALYACAETCRVLGCTQPELLAHLVRRAGFVRDCRESGRLANHQALAALAMFTVGRLAGVPSLEDAARARAELALSWQDPEGWFAEYEGCDPGYQTLSISFLARLREASGWAFLDEPLDRAVALARDFLHPDGSYGGEYGSRNTFNYMPDGFERLGPRLPAAREVADGWLWGAVHGADATNDDDRIFVHAASGQLEAARVVRSLGDRPLPEVPPEMGAGFKHYERAGLLVVHRGDWHLVVGLRKGGVFKAWHGRRLVATDTGLVATCPGRRCLLVTHGHHPPGGGPGRLRVTVDEARGTARVEAPFCRTARPLSSPLKQMLFRAGTCTVGRLAPDLVRRALQHVLITRLVPTSLTVTRTFDWSRDPPVVVDRVEFPPGAPRVGALYRSSDATSVYVATSNAAQPGALVPWTDLTPRLASLRERGCLEIRWELPA
jgi:hypothetical protein